MKTDTPDILYVQRSGGGIADVSKHSASQYSWYFDGEAERYFSESALRQLSANLVEKSNNKYREARGVWMEARDEMYHKMAQGELKTRDLMFFEEVFGVFGISAGLLSAVDEINKMLEKPEEEDEN